MRLLDTLTDALDLLEELGFDAALLGGLAVSAWAEPRFTRDVDLAVAVDSDDMAERLIHSFVQRGYRLLTTVEQMSVHRLATARLLPPGEMPEGMVLDLLFASSGIEKEIVAAAERIDIGASSPVPVATVGHLVALKLLAHDPKTRPHDGLDLQALRAVLTPTDLESARIACETIEERGYARGRNLSERLEEWR